MIKVKTLLKEEVFGRNMILYHGTQNLSIFYDVFNGKAEFVAGRGSGAMYGKGLYTVYKKDLNAKTFTGDYGHNILKLSTQITNRFFICDYEIYKKIYGKENENFIEDQIQDLGITINEQYMKKLIYDMKKYEDNGFQSDWFTSDIALSITNAIKSENKNSILDGIFYTGRNDGPCCVVFNPNTVQCLGYYSVESGSLEYKNSKEAGLTNVNQVRKVLNNKLNLFYKQISKNEEVFINRMLHLRESNPSMFFVIFPEVLLKVSQKDPSRFNNYYQSIKDNTDLTTFYQILENVAKAYSKNPDSVDFNTLMKPLRENTRYVDVFLKSLISTGKIPPQANKEVCLTLVRHKYPADLIELTLSSSKNTFEDPEGELLRYAYINNMSFVYNYLIDNKKTKDPNGYFLLKVISDQKEGYEKLVLKTLNNQISNDASGYILKKCLDKNDVNLAKKLVLSGSSMDKVGQLLDALMKNNDIETIENLVKLKRTYDFDGELFQYYLSGREYQKAKFLIVNKLVSQHQLLIHCLETKSYDFAKNLIDANLVTDDYLSALEYCLKNNNYSFAKYLVQHINYEKSDIKYEVRNFISMDKDILDKNNLTKSRLEILDFFKFIFDYIPKETFNSILDKFKQNDEVIYTKLLSFVMNGSEQNKLSNHKKNYTKFDENDWEYFLENPEKAEKYVEQQFGDDDDSFRKEDFWRLYNQFAAKKSSMKKNEEERDKKVDPFYDLQDKTKGHKKLYESTFPSWWGWEQILKNSRPE